MVKTEGGQALMRLPEEHRLTADDLAEIDGIAAQYDAAARAAVRRAAEQGGLQDLVGTDSIGFAPAVLILAIYDGIGAAEAWAKIERALESGELPISWPQ